MGYSVSKLLHSTKLESEHYLPAFKEAIKMHNSEIDEIVKNTEDATFSNTIEAIDYSGEC